VNLQGADLTKVNLRGADLSMANLRARIWWKRTCANEPAGHGIFGRQHDGRKFVWRAGIVGGQAWRTNLFDATLPEAVGAYDGGKTIGSSRRQRGDFIFC